MHQPSPFPLPLIPQNNPMKNLLVLFTLAFTLNAGAQVAINTDNSVPDNSAMLDVKSSDKGILVPRMSAAKRDAISNPANGLLIFCYDDNNFYVNRGTSASPDWASLDSYWGTNGTDMYYIGGNVGIGLTNPTAKLDVRGSTPDDGIIFQIGNSDVSHRLILFGGRQIDPNPYIQWKQGDPLRFTTDEGGWSEKMRISSNGNVGIGTSNPGAALEINSTTQGFLPPRITQDQINSITPVAGLQVFNITTLRPNYFNGTEWRNFDGTIAFGIGVSCLGGTVAYILQSGDPGYDANVLHGLIATPSNLTAAQWGCYGTEIPGADGTALGTGNQNTMDVVAGCTTAGIPAQLCVDLTLNGYSDWYLPSTDELNKLWLNRSAIGGFVGDYFWSSSEFSSTHAKSQSFSGGTIANSPKTSFHYVRPIRSF
jgi:hypothetical protein